MRTARFFAAALTLGCTLALPRATDAELVAALSNHLVAVTTGFSGTEVLLFGTAAEPGDVLVVIRGPESRHVVRRKGRRFGIWVNETEMTFVGVPGYYAVAASTPPADILAERITERHQIGIDQLQLVASGDPPPGDVGAFRAALVRNKIRAGLYDPEPKPITFLGGGLFRTDLYVPANAPIGTYSVGIYLVQDGELASAQSIPLLVSKVGFEARLFDFAHRYSLAYGVLAIVIAGVAGWLANLVFRKG
jgi:uncharacterized protein (TIGR02186 family)